MRWTPPLQYALNEAFLLHFCLNAWHIQVYRGCDIATAKASKDERKIVPHHLLDVCDPSEHFTAAQYIRTARNVVGGGKHVSFYAVVMSVEFYKRCGGEKCCLQIDALHSKGILPVVVGGTQLYIQLLLWESAVDLYGCISPTEKEFDSRKCRRV